MKGRAAPFVAVAGLVAIAVAAVAGHTREDSLSADEPIHILSGYLSVAAQSAIVNIEHPPLMKVLAGLAVAALPLEPAPDPVPMGGPFTGYGRRFFYENRVSPDAITAAARAPFLLVFASLIVLLFLAGRRLWGSAAGLFAAALVAFDPNFVAHAGVVHTDLGAALAFLATVLAWERVQRHPTAGRILLAGLCLGLSLATKFSTVYLVPILLVQTLLAVRRQDHPARAAGRRLIQLGAVLLAGFVVLFAVYAAVTARMDRADQKQVLREKIAFLGKAPRLAEGLVSLSETSPALAHYLGGLASVARQNAVGGGVTYLAGQVSTEGFPHYFLVAFLAKSSLAFLAVTAVAAWAVLRRQGPLRPVARLLLVPVALLFLASAGSSYNIGIRHLLPIYPFLALAGGALLARLWEERRRSRAIHVAALLLAALPLVSAMELVRIHPHELSYFNPFVGGPEHGRRLLTDSNVDWGLDLKRLAAELQRRRIADPTVIYFGGDNVRYRTGVADFSAEPVVRGRFIAISAFHEAAGPEFWAYHGLSQMARALEAVRRDLAARGVRVGRVGYSIDLFELPPPGAAPP